ncbi:hypothetical protein XAC3810_240125 [Xanthomonas citri pv. citri]|uniref:Uncharacterized protein n=1 Tax=Xanthomonas citri pv. citri TaxID=611301 RepID=A0A0U5FB00_XANCI|nr:hypothetical protein XAC9322_220123 [Xanthomonas citri pv. citri]CEE21381.1 hypothetical protein XAC1083_220125 [Xanthomonas citri pv. citri]CEE29826.1 hypothetical protein XAC3810_240125 [Xanthomonas citri pv. citri]CEE32077.1 hypothetical protein XAC902_270124 [Xanthomonas citri pv. citri]CEE36116.1 hypothetical protein XAC908_340122 [Xanthomonas citri pv. citri]
MPGQNPSSKIAASSDQSVGGGESSGAGRMVCTIAGTKSFTLAYAASDLSPAALARAHLDVTELLHSGHVWSECNRYMQSCSKAWTDTRDQRHRSAEV